MNNDPATTLYQDFTAHMQKTADMKYAAAVLQWDQETYLPAKGANARARQLATLSEAAHALATDEKLGILLKELASKNIQDFKQRKNVELVLEEYEKQKKFSGEFVRNMSEAVSNAYYAWIDARQKNTFSIYAPALEKLVALKKQEADILGYEDHPYNALLKEFEKSASVSMLDKLFNEITAPLKELVLQVRSKQKVDDSFMHQFFPKEQQWQWSLYLIKQLGFDMEAGRQDISEHPFTTNFSAKDVRITTRIDENDFKNMTWSCIHETGHALYEQGLPDEDYGLPSGEYASLSIHESQSRLWENCVGRGYDFWQYYYPKLKEYFPEQFETVALERFYQSINKVEPSLIRTEADELTYHFHVIIRYHIEKEIIQGSLQVKDIPAKWNELYKENLGVDVPDDRSGCLQDVHWSHGSFGYFPTYSLGSFYAAQFWIECNKQLPDLKNEISNGNTTSLSNWLHNNIYQYGKQYKSEELCKKITGRELDVKCFLDYAQEKYLSI